MEASVLDVDNLRHQLEVVTLKLNDNEKQIKRLEEQLKEKEAQLQNHLQRQQLYEHQIQTLEEINQDLRSKLSVASQHQRSAEQQDVMANIKTNRNWTNIRTMNTHPFFNRNTFQKVPGTANDKGLMFEVHMALLLSLRCQLGGKCFQLASNIQGVGKFDDIVLHMDDERPMCLQLKHTGAPIRHSEIFSFSGRFSLLSYFISYRDEVLKNLGDYCDIIIYTNADMNIDGISTFGENFLTSSDNGRSFFFSNDVQEVNCLHTNFIKYEEFLSVLLQRFEEFSEFELTSYVNNEITEFSLLNSVLPFSYRLNALRRFPTKEHVKQLLDEARKVGDLSMYPIFLQKLKVFCRQANVHEMETVIKKELGNLTGLRDNNDIFAKLVSKMKDWWSSAEGYYLTESSPLWSDVIVAEIGKLSATKLAEVISYNLRMKESSVQQVMDELLSVRFLHLFVEGDCTALASCQVYQALEDELNISSIIMNLSSALVNKDPVLGAWKSRWGMFLVLEANEPGLDLADLLSGVRDILKIHHDKTLVMITNINDLATINQIRTMNGEGYTERRVKISLSDLTEETQNHLLRTYVTYQGYEVPFSKLVLQHEELKKDVSGVLLMKLLKKKYIRIGEDIPEPIDYYITRTLRRQGEALFVETPRDFKDRVVVVTGEPGMGKSTLLTHLSKVIKEGDPCTWVVRINISDHTSYLDSIKDNYNGNSAIDFLRSAARLKSRRDANLDECIINYCWQINGGMTLLIDGFDEICPMYETLVINIIKDLLLTQIDKIWVTSRLVCKEAIETAVTTAAFSLDSFTAKDSHDFLKKIWLKGDEDEDAINEFIKKLLNLVSSSLNDTEKYFTGVPLQTLFIGEMFEDKLKEFIATKCDNLPISLDIEQMYDEFFRKKCKINYEKRGYDITKKGVKADFEIFVKEAENVHKACALVTILLQSDIDRLSDNVETKVRKFLAGVKQGNDLIGVIMSVDDGKPVFIHRTFAEYFVAKWFSEHYEQSRDIIGEIAQRPSFYMVNGMLNRIKSKGYELQIAVINNDKNAFQELLLPENVNKTDSGGRTALHYAAGFSSYEYFTASLLESGADPGIKDDIMQWTALRYADAAKMWYAIEVILRRGGDSSDLVITKTNIMQPKYIKPAIRVSCEHGYDVLLNFLCKEGIDVNISLDEKRHTPLHIAVKYAENNQNFADDSVRTLFPSTKSERIVECLLKYEADVNEKTLNGSTILHLLAETGNMQLIQYTLERTMDESEEELRSGTQRLFRVLQRQMDKIFTQKVLTQHRDVMGRTAHDVALECGNVEVATYLKTTQFAIDGFLRDKDIQIDDLHLISAVHFLVEHRNADIHSKDNNGQVALHHSATLGEVNIAKYLVEKGADTNVQDKNGNTPLHLSAESATLKMATFLVDVCGNCNMLSKDNRTPLHKACTVGCLDMVKHLVANGAETYVFDVFGDSPLHLSVDYGHVTVVKYLVDSCKVAVDIKGGDTTPLHIACSRGHINIVKYLIHKGADSYMCNDDGNTALHIAADKGHLNVLKFFIQKCSKDINIRNIFNITLLYKACRSGHLDVVQYLMQNGAKAEEKIEDGDTAIHVSAFNGRLSTVTFLVDDCKSDPNVRGNHEWTPLHSACVEGHLNVIAYLVNKGAETGATDRFGNIPMHVSAYYGKIEVLCFLLQKCVDDSRRQNLKGRIPLHEACREGHLDVTKCLVGACAETVIPDVNGDTPLIIAAEYGKLSVVAFLIEECRNEPNVKNNKGRSPLHMSCIGGHLNVVEYLCKNGSVTDERDVDGCTPLHVSSEQGKLNVVAFLLEEYGGDPNVRDGANMTPLHMACREGHVNIVAYLIEKHKADRQVKSNQGETPLDLARGKDHHHVVNHLLFKTKVKMSTHAMIRKFLEN